LITSALDLPLRTFKSNILSNQVYLVKFCSVLIILVIHAGCDKQGSLMRGVLCGKLHSGRSQSSINSQLLVENRDLYLPTCIRRLR